VRLVLDTNVVVSAVVWGGMPYKLIEAAAAGDVELVTSAALLAELRNVLGRGHLASSWPHSAPASSWPSGSMASWRSAYRRSQRRASCPAMSMTIT